jgi:hypothetical protein
MCVLTTVPSVIFFYFQQQAAEIFLFMMSNFYNNFPSPAGASQNDSVVPDEVEENAIFFMNYERQIFSISQGTNALGGTKSVTTTKFESRLINFIFSSSFH